MLNTIIQIILSIFLIAIMAFISYSVYNREFISSITLSNSNKKITKIFTGIVDYTIVKNIDIETYDKNDFSYLDINPSINQNGGSEYSYNFWIFFSPHLTNNVIIYNNNNGPASKLELIANNPIKFGSSTPVKPDLNTQYIVLFYKGESQQIMYNTKNAYDCDNSDTLFDYPILVKNPLIKIKNDASEIIVEYNNINHPETYNSTSDTTFDCKTSNNTYTTRNLNKFGIKDIDVANYRDKFNMVTVVFQEQSKKDNIFNNNKSNCKVYFNGELKADKLSNTNSLEEEEINNFKSRVMKSNLSKLHINPEKINGTITNITLADTITTVSPLQMSDLTYYNYALTSVEIKRLYENGFNKYDASFSKRISKSYTKGFNNKDYEVNPI
jgi:hypothetical protein